MTEIQLAREFCQFINWWMSAEELAEANKRNAAEPNPSVCHTHDFIDANEAMIAACGSFNFDPLDGPELCGKAWDLAKAVGFDGEKL